MSDVTIAPAGLRVVGRAVSRHDARDKVAAATAYAADWALPGMLHAVVLRSPHPSARITRLDTTAATALPGVAVVLTARDVPRNTLCTDVPGQTTAVGPLRATLHVLAEDRVRHQGEPVALVAAETREQAQAAVEAIDVDVRPDAGRVRARGRPRPGRAASARGRQPARALAGRAGRRRRRPSRGRPWWWRASTRPSSSTPPTSSRSRAWRGSTPTA